jgi:hypothetical protein
MFQSQLDSDFANITQPFDETSIREAITFVHPGKSFLLHVNASGVYIALQKVIDPHTRRCLLGLQDTFRSIWNSHAIERLLRPDESISVLLNFHASVMMESLGKILPVFSYAKPLASKDILIPRPYLNELFNFKPATSTWEFKVPKAIFRGTLTNILRAELADFSKANPDIVDARVTSIIPTSSLGQQYGNISLGHKIPMASQTRHYKYVINVDGWGCADRLPMLLVSDSVTMYHGATHVDPVECVEWYHGGLRTNENFVHFDKSFSDLRDTIEWLRDNDAEAQRIAVNGRDFVHHHLTRTCSDWYFSSVLRRYHQLYLPKNSRTDAEQWLDNSPFGRVISMSEMHKLK